VEEAHYRAEKAHPRAITALPAVKKAQH
jgi:hypothetical protein